MAPKPKAKEYADPGYQSDGKPRLALDTSNQVRYAALHMTKAEVNVHVYTPEQVRRINLRITAAWKKMIDAKGPPADPLAIDALRTLMIKQADPPDPDDDESQSDYVDRCVEELTDEDSDEPMDEDEAEEACQLAWDEYNDDERGIDTGAVVHKTVTTEGTGMTFVLSDAKADRFGDIIEVEGWQLEDFRRNPIALFGHSHSFPIGKWANVEVRDGALRGDLQLAPKGTSDRIDEIRKLIEADILRATSVGFRPLESEPLKDDSWAMRYTKQELVECSVVAVPANPNALAVAKSLGVSKPTLRLAFGEHANMNVERRSLSQSTRGKHADTKRGAGSQATGEHADPKPRAHEGKPMLLSQRIQEAEKGLLALQDQLDKHIETIDDDNPTEEQMVITEDLSAKIETKQRHITSLKNVEAKNGGIATEAGAVARAAANGHMPPAAATIIKARKKPDPIDYLWRAALIRMKSRIDGVSYAETRHKIYGDDEATRLVTDLVLRAATAPAETTVTGWAAELVRTVWAEFMEVLLPESVYPKLSASGLALTFGANGRIVIPTRNLTPSISGSFVGEGAPIPVRQGQFASQTLTPKKMAVITTWTREMDEYSVPAIEGLLRQAILEDTAISLDTVLLDNNPATVIRPPGLRSYGTGLTPAALATPFENFVSDYSALYGSLLTATHGNVRKPTLLVNPTDTLALSLISPTGVVGLFPFMAMIDSGKLLKADLIESATVPPAMAIMVDAADFTTAGGEGPRMEISDQATLHMEDTTPLDITSGPSGTAVVATPVKSMWQTDSLALRMIMRMNWIMRRPVVSWMTGIAW
jgi:HK97 family phage prohead protease/HK97 family phage major capsid protein